MRVCVYAALVSSCELVSFVTCLCPTQILLRASVKADKVEAWRRLVYISNNKFESMEACNKNREYGQRTQPQYRVAKVPEFGVCVLKTAVSVCVYVCVCVCTETAISHSFVETVVPAVLERAWTVSGMSSKSARL